MATPPLTLATGVAAAKDPAGAQFNWVDHIRDTAPVHGFADALAGVAAAPLAAGPVGYEGDSRDFVSGDAARGPGRRHDDLASEAEEELSNHAEILGWPF